MSILCQNMRTGNDNDFWNSGDPIFRRPQTGKRGKLWTALGGSEKQYEPIIRHLLIDLERSGATRRVNQY